ncbi:MAG TPA: Smr/MutS family protein [Acetobacteraceae bacterium]|nr:Smr/MutS family protein [Acetobacteraceae bacterium]
MAARRGLTDADRAAWAAYARAVVPLPGRAIPSPAAAEAEEPIEAAPLERLAIPIAAPAGVLPPLVIGAQPPGLDNATWARFRGGKLAAARSLDLHGRSAQRAFHALEAFLHRAHIDRLRCVEVITGRGRSEEGGVIRRELPLWLNLPPLRPLLLGAAHPHAANPGAVRLLLRRAR